MNARITFWRQGGAAPCFPHSYNFIEEDQYDFHSILMHELGHAFYNVYHPDEPENGCTWSGEQTIMLSAIQTGRRKRVVKDWDRDIFQWRHGHRAPYSRLLHSYRSSGGWTVANEGATYLTDMIYRPGSVPQNQTIRNIGYLEQPSTTPEDWGGGTPSVGQYRDGLFTKQAVSSDAWSFMRPVAVASRPSSNEVLVAYVKRKFGYGFSLSEIGKVCYRYSMDAGLTYSAETCFEDWQVHRPGLTAAYSAQGNVYLIGFAIGTSTSDYAAIGMIPAPGSGIAPHYVSLGSHETWHAPAVACSAVMDASNCRIVWEDRTVWGCAVTVQAGVGYLGQPPFGGQLVWYEPPQTTPCIPLADTPGLAYNATDDSYELLWTSNHDAIYSYRSNRTDLNWVGHGDVWNDPNSFVLTAVVGYRSTWNQLQAWFLRYL
jgi:hypothetical protein